MTWLDAQRATGWCTPEELPAPTLVITRGWLVRESFGPSGYVVLAGSMSQAEVWGEVIAIPRGMIVHATVIGQPPAPAATESPA